MEKYLNLLTLNNTINLTYRKNRKSVKMSEIITDQTRTFDIFDIKSDTIEQPKTSRKLTKTLRQAEKVSPDSPLHNETKKSKHFFNNKKKRSKNNKSI